MKIGQHLIRLLLALALCAPALAHAQDGDTLELFVRRNVGYSGIGEIQGSFRMEATAPPDVGSVTFYIDTTVVGTDDTAGLTPCSDPNGCGPRRSPPA